MSDQDVVTSENSVRSWPTSKESTIARKSSSTVVFFETSTKEEDKRNVENCDCSASKLFSHKRSDCVIKASSNALASGVRMAKPDPLIRLLPSWNYTFGTAVKVLRSAGYSVPRDVDSIRFLTDHGIPTWLPGLPGDIICRKIKEPAGEWIAPKPLENHISYPPSLSNSTVPFILYLHGGAFCLCTTGTHRGMLMRLAFSTNAVIFAADYRRPPEHPHPGPLEDCLAAYQWALQFVPPSRIVLAGDSAGGALVVATILGAVERGLPTPAGGILLSPWVDLQDAGSSDSWTRNAPYDYLPFDLASMFAEIYRGSATWEEVSPTLFTNLSALPPLLIECGDSEVLVDQIVAFAAKCLEAGVQVDARVRRDMVHVYPMFAFSGMPQCAEAFDSMAAFVAKVVPVDPIDRTASTSSSTSPETSLLVSPVAAGAGVGGPSEGGMCGSEAKEETRVPLPVLGAEVGVELPKGNLTGTDAKEETLP